MWIDVGIALKLAKAEIGQATLFGALVVLNA
jgi:hypothetical protein